MPATLAYMPKTVQIRVSPAIARKLNTIANALAHTEGRGHVEVSEAIEKLLSRDIDRHFRAAMKTLGKLDDGDDSE